MDGLDLLRNTGLDPSPTAAAALFLPRLKLSAGHPNIKEDWWKREKLALRIASEHYDDLAVEFDAAEKAYWCRMAPRGRPSFTPSLLADLAKMRTTLRGYTAEATPADPVPIRYFVLASRIPGIYNLGGDLGLFVALIRAADREGVRAYAYSCVEAIYHNAAAYGQNLVTVALVQGNALGGGFEAALSCDVIIAERGAKFGLPEVLFNLFPGMGALSFLSRRLNGVEAERMVASGHLYSAEELHEKGIVDVLAEDGEGEHAAHEWLAREGRRHNAQSAIMRARRRVQPVTLEELRDVTEIWVDAAMALGESDLRRMQRLTMAQDRRQAAAA